jgi:hypothetical protein
VNTEQAPMFIKEKGQRRMQRKELNMHDDSIQRTSLREEGREEERVSFRMKKMRG